MAKRARLPSSDEEEQKSESSGKKHKDVKKEKGSKDKEKDKEKHKEKDKKDKDKDKGKDRGKDKGKDKEKSKEKKTKADDELRDPMEKKAKHDKKEGKESASSAAPGSKAEKKQKKDKGPPTKELVFSGPEIFRIAAKPFGMELDGALVVDLFDSDSMAVEEGVQIGWQVLSVNGKSVPGEVVGAATKALREAEQAMAKNDSEVRVVFITDEPDNWKLASKRRCSRR